MITTLHAAAWAICETSGPRCEELCPGCLEQAKAAGRVWLGAANQVARGETVEAAGNEYQSDKPGHFWDRESIYGQGRDDAAAAIEAMIGEKPTA